ncbi:hypothetical protein COCVIDRAFT_115799 [Bipolaris victoriae FI3]|uniref:Uncharacterized protein n=1 Tax=Bipolaris victoriae (strain FI3) TaxID=930091 RepID=W7E0X1_BIPV3|nr:hypothetical protein COCVIDRAFT_115799 [Bipolaris victoriae FI3]
MCLAVGSAVVHSFVDAGYERIIVCDDSLAAMESLKIPGLKGSIQIHSLRLDHDDDENWERTILAASNVFGDINDCVNCSEVIPAIALSKPTTDLEPTDFKGGLQDSRALWLCCRAQLRYSQSQPANPGARTIVNIIPYSNLGTHPAHAILAASTYGRVGMTKTFEKDCNGSYIRVNAVCPALTVSQTGNAPILEQHL